MRQRSMLPTAQAYAPITFGPMIAGSLRRGVFRSFGAMLIKSSCDFRELADVFPLRGCDRSLKCCAWNLCAVA